MIPLVLFLQEVLQPSLRLVVLSFQVTMTFLNKEKSLCMCHILEENLQYQVRYKSLSGDV